VEILLWRNIAVAELTIDYVPVLVNPPQMPEMMTQNAQKRSQCQLMERPRDCFGRLVLHSQTRPQGNKIMAVDPQLGDEKIRARGNPSPLINCSSADFITMHTPLTTKRRHYHCGRHTR
jgi:hypothetical protein